MIRSTLLEHLKFYSDKPVEILIEFCKLSNEYLSDGKNEKKINVAAKKLEVPVETIEQSLEALVCLLIDTKRNNIEDKDYDILKDIGFSEDHINVVIQFVSSNKNQLLSNLNYTDDLRLKDLSWRLEARIASRSLLSQAEPKIKLKLHLNNSSTTDKEILMETDPKSISHIIETLEMALIESKAHRTRNFVKAFQH